MSNQEGENEEPAQELAIPDSLFFATLERDEFSSECPSR